MKQLIEILKFVEGHNRLTPADMEKAAFFVFGDLLLEVSEDPAGVIVTATLKTGVYTFLAGDAGYLLKRYAKKYKKNGDLRAKKVTWDKRNNRIQQAVKANDAWKLKAAT